MTSLLRTAVAPAARSALRPAASRVPVASFAATTPAAASTFSTTCRRGDSQPPGKQPQQSPRKHEDQVDQARKTSSNALFISLAAGSVIAAAYFGFNRLSAEGQQQQQASSSSSSSSSTSGKRLSYAERVKASLARANASGGGVQVFHSAASGIDGEDSPLSGEGTDEADVAAQEGINAPDSSASLDVISDVVEEDPGEGQEAAYDPSTGQINWDCPCLGGMATGPCGEEFKEAFSCFVFSEQEPKGVECVGKFKGMQDCFRRHPEEYKEELEMEEEVSRAERGGNCVYECGRCDASVPDSSARIA
ncbi:hypothetical protein BCV69DRAFT_284838 [Microstroma glucosiphilum]|uniref:Mitochondrial intermembrane space import and assembly protein 40 n=1 Tax=Pseudomicrostroma glucosiphilum TaxID=1684307 RepID=A0A316U305_9BASI|nr:hypothetical protein BCV69DRAFT_284838 [Pseudomicrostroma glucosiphilum]PWN18861.1 hypothetical protein BCV69DRAFT_284838 [Pseudomicrostroma glucosiphilum]